MKKSLILKYLIPFYIKGFYNDLVLGHVLSPVEKDCDLWFLEFKNKLTTTGDKNFFPICRLSDGEYIFICGKQHPLKNTLFSQVFSFIYFYATIIFSSGNLKASTAKGVSSGNYTKDDMFKSRKTYIKNLLCISELGILALHLTYGKKPFQQRYHYKLAQVFKKNEIFITERNYYPFYFVYAFFVTDDFKYFMSKKKILIITGADDDKIKNVNDYFIKLSAELVHFFRISKDRSLYDKIDINSLLTFGFDVCFVAAGLGKPNILMQLKPLNCLCIDVGYMFEVWANPVLAYKRPWCSKEFKKE